MHGQHHSPTFTFHLREQFRDQHLSQHCVHSCGFHEWERQPYPTHNFRNSECPATCHGTLGRGYLWSARLHPHTCRSCSPHQILHNKLPPRWRRTFWSRRHWLCLECKRPTTLFLVDQLFQHTRRMHERVRRATCPRLSPQSPCVHLGRRGDPHFRHYRRYCTCRWRNTREHGTTQTTLLHRRRNRFARFNMPNLRAGACYVGCSVAAANVSSDL